MRFVQLSRNPISTTHTSLLAAFTTIPYRVCHNFLPSFIDLSKNKQLSCCVNSCDWLSSFQAFVTESNTAFSYRVGFKCLTLRKWKLDHTWKTIAMESSLLENKLVRIARKWRTPLFGILEMQSQPHCGCGDHEAILGQNRHLQSLSASYSEKQKCWLVMPISVCVFSVSTPLMSGNIAE